MKFIGDFARRIGREPVAIGGATILTLDAQFPNMGAAWKAAITAWIIVVQRSYSSPKAAVEEAKQAGRDEALADVSTLAAAQPAPIFPCRRR